MKALTLLLAAGLALSACGGPAPEDQATSGKLSPDADFKEITDMAAAQAKLKAAEEKQQPVQVGNQSVTADNVDVSVQNAMQAAQQSQAANSNSVATTENYFNAQ